MNCMGCRFYDKNDAKNAYGTCEPQDVDYHCSHECNLTKLEIRELELLTGKKQTDERFY